MHAMRLTGLHDVRLMGDDKGPRAIGSGRGSTGGDLDPRCWASLPGERIDEAAALGLTSGFGNDRTRVGRLKSFADGGMGGRTAWMLEPYLNCN